MWGGEERLGQTGKVEIEVALEKVFSGVECQARTNIHKGVEY